MTTTTAVATISYSDIERLAGNIARSGLFGIKTAEQAVALMMIAQAEGRHPALAARDYDIIQGRPAKKAEAMMRDFIAYGGKIQWHALTDEKADATFSHPQGGTVRIEWDMKRANAAELTKNPMWRKFPRQMLRSRVVSEGIRTIYPSATSGMYVPEEVSDAPEEPKPADTFTGTTIEAAPEPPKKRTVAEWLDKFELDTTVVQSPEEANAIICGEESMTMKKRLRGDALKRYDEIVHATLKKWYHEQPDDGSSASEDGAELHKKDELDDILEGRF